MKSYYFRFEAESKLKKYENNQGRANEYVEAFTLGIDWHEYIQMIDEMSKLNKKDIIDFANQYYKDNYAVVYKEQGCRYS